MLERWRERAEVVDLQHRKANRIRRTFLRVVGFVVRKDWSGACHAVSAVLAVLLREQGVEADLCLGEAAVGDGAFDNSWVEVDGVVYDAAIVRPLDPSRACAPVLHGIDLGTGQPTMVRHGVASGHPHDSAAEAIRAMPFATFMEAFPHHPRRLWGIAADIAESMKLDVSATSLAKRHGAVSWSIRPQR